MTEAEPEPAFVMVSVSIVAGSDWWRVRLNIAVTLCTEFIMTVQASVPEHLAPLQPAKRRPISGGRGECDKAILLWWCWQLAMQFSPVPSETQPAPVPAKVTVSV